jgi:acyl carrier protein
MNDRGAAESQILEEIAAMIREVIGEEWAADVAIRMETLFGDDLELESIEFVALSEKLQGRYGKTVNFAGWLSEMMLEEILGLNVGRVVEFVARCQRQEKG